MRRMFAIVLVISVFLWGCFAYDDPRQNTASFYYLRANILYGADDGVIAAEEREYTDPDLGILLSEYLCGPVSEGFASPFPAGTKLLSLNRSADVLTLQLSTEFDSLTDLDHILACACLSQTCFDLCDAAAVTIQIAGTDRSITMTRDSLTLSDSTDTIHATIGTETPAS